MRNLVIKAVAGAGLLLSGITASAQYPYQYQPRDQARYRYNDTQDERQLVERIQADLNRASASFFMSSSDRYRIDAAREQLNDVENLLNSGTLNRRELGEAMFALRRVLNSNTLSERSRDMLENDLNRLQELRFRFNWH